MFKSADLSVLQTGGKVYLGVYDEEHTPTFTGGALTSSNNFDALTSTDFVELIVATTTGKELGFNAHPTNIIVRPLTANEVITFQHVIDIYRKVETTAINSMIADRFKDEMRGK